MAITGFVVDAHNAAVPTLPWVEVVGRLQGTANTRDYEVPVRLMYSKGWWGGAQNNIALVEPFNVTSQQFDGFAGSIGDLGLQLCLPNYLFGDVTTYPGSTAFAYVSFECMKDSLDQQVIANNASLMPGSISPHSHTSLIPGGLPILVRPTWKLGGDAGDALNRHPEDGYVVIRDVSEFARDLATYITPVPTGPIPAPPYTVVPWAPPAVTKAIGFGYSQNGIVLRGFLMDGYNGTAVENVNGLGDAFVNDKVFEGSLIGAAGTLVGRLEATEYICRLGYKTNYQLRTDLNGAPPVGCGIAINLSTESDVELFEAHLARETPAYNTPATGADFYAYYEVAGVPHASLEILKGLGNPTPVGNVVRMMVDHIRARILDTNYVLPANAALAGAAQVRATALPTPPQYAPVLPNGGFKSVWVGIADSEDGNLQGGVRLPHVRTRIPVSTGYEAIGAPLGCYRGFYVNTVPYAENTLPDAPYFATYPTYTQLGGYEFIVMLGGTVAYWEPAIIASRYRDDNEYVTFVGEAADYAITSKWLLAADRFRYVNPAAVLTYQQLMNYGLRRMVAPSPLA